MADNELEIKSFIEERLRRVIDDKDIYYHADKIQAKLKALGYEQVWEICPECKGIGELMAIDFGYPSSQTAYKCNTCKGTGKKRKLVEWDREKVADLMHLGWLVGEAKMGKRITDEVFQLYIDSEADQLKEILTGGKDVA